MSPRPLILALSIHQDSHFGHVSGQLLSRKETGELINWTDQFSEDRRSDALPLLEDLRVTCQWSPKSLTPYAFDCSFHPYTVDLPMARRMVKTLTTIERRIKSARYGLDVTFADYLKAVAKALGVDSICWIENSEQAPRRTGEFILTEQPLDTLAEVIDTQVKAAQARW